MSESSVEPDDRWDAGDMGCSRLIVGLRARVERLDSGRCIEVVARDLAAPIDIRAWCRMTGHELVAAEHPVYVIRRRGDESSSPA